MEFDRPTRTIANFAASVNFSDLGDQVVAEVVRQHLDSIGCALGGFNARPCQIARKISLTATTSPGCSVFGIAPTVAPEQAVFANTSMVRNLDLNDLYTGEGGGHLSDMIPAVFAA